MLTDPVKDLAALGLQDSTLFREQCFVNGRWIGESTYAVENPHNRQVLGRVPHFGRTETELAVNAAERALPTWRGLSAKERSDTLDRWAGLCLQHQNDLARIMTLEQGKPLAEARGEILYGLLFCNGLLVRRGAYTGTRSLPTAARAGL